MCGNISQTHFLIFFSCLGISQRGLGFPGQHLEFSHAPIFQSRANSRNYKKSALGTYIPAHAAIKLNNVQKIPTLMVGISSLTNRRIQISNQRMCSQYIFKFKKSPRVNFTCFLSCDFLLESTPDKKHHSQHITYSTIQIHPTMPIRLDNNGKRKALICEELKP